MRTKTIVQPFEKVSRADYKKIYRLNFRDNGLMQEDLTKLNYLARAGRKTEAKVVMIKDTESDRVLSWALVQPYEDGDSKNSAQFYTRAKYRGKGYGKRVMKQVLKIDDNPHIYPHDERALGFFKSFEPSVELAPYVGSKLKK